MISICEKPAAAYDGVESAWSGDLNWDQNTMSTEADTCRKFVVPKLQAAGWDNELDALLPAILDRAFKGEL